MNAFKNIVWVVLSVTVCACSSGGSGSKTSNSPTSSQASTSQTSTNQSSSSSATAPTYDIELSAIGAPFDVNGIPEGFPVGTVEQLPILNIYTDNGAPVTSREEYLPGTFELIDNNEISAQGVLEIRGRGNSTWDWDKKPYRIKLETSSPMLNMPKSRHWVLLANYADKTLIRNDIAFMFSESLDMAFTPRSRHIEFHFNGAYQGAYQLTDQIRVDNDRVDIPELEVTDQSEDLISGGYLLEIDFRLNRDFCQTAFNQQIYDYCAGGVNALREVEFCIDSDFGMEPFCLKDPDYLMEPEWAAQREYIEEYIAQTEEALFGDDFADPDTGYAAYLDVDSTVNYYIINELFKNADGATASAYLYKQRDGKLFFGPIWDFDLALGNAGYDGLANTSGWRIRQAPWFERLFQDPAFEQKVKQRWAELKSEGKINRIFEYAKARAIWMEEQQQQNFNLWQIFYWETWYTRVLPGSYRAEVNEMLRWQHERALWMDAQLNF